MAGIRTSKKPRGFTLIEVLVVVTIISLLMSLLLSGLSSARRSAKRSLCLTNIRTTIGAIQIYASQHNDIIPFGPDAPPPRPSNLYPVTGLVTSQLSLMDGRPMGLGLLVENYLGNEPEVLFCPDSDDDLDAQNELAKIGKEQAIGGYFYRHGSNTLESLSEGLTRGRGVWKQHIRLSRLGDNTDGRRIRALVVDHNFTTNVSLEPFGIRNRTNHDQEWVHAGFVEGNAMGFRNKDEDGDGSRDLTVYVGNFPYEGPNFILDMFERLDAIAP